MDAGLGSGIAHHTHGFARTFAGAGVGLRALAAHGQPAHVADAAIAFDALQTLEVHADFAAQIAFNDVFALLNRVDDLRELRLGQVFRADGTVNVRALEDLQRVDRADAVNVAERNINALVRRNFNTNDAGHKSFSSFSAFTFVSIHQTECWSNGALGS